MEINDSLTAHEQVQIDFHGIELHGINGVGDTEHFPGLEEQEVATEFGLPLRVYIRRGAKCAGSIVTYHDLGTNHRSLLRFFNQPDMRIIANYFTVYHVCAPGHHDTAGPVASEVIVAEDPERGGVSDGLLGNQGGGGGGGGGGSRSGSSSGGSSVYAIYGQGRGNNPSYPSMDELAEMLQSVVQHFRLSYFVGVGIGAGANILTRYALRHSDRVLSLFLVNANAHTDNTYYNWFFANYNREWEQLRRGVLTTYAQQALELHWFGHSESDSVDLIERYRRHLLSLCLPNVAGYIQSYNLRTDLGMQRDGRTLTVQTFLLTGSLAKDMAKGLVAMNARCDPARTEYVVADDTDGMMLEEQPERAAGYLLGLLRQTGLVVFLTPARVRDLAIKLSTDEVMRRLEPQPGVC